MITATARNHEEQTESSVQNVPFHIAKEWSRIIALPPYNMTEITFTLNDSFELFNSLEALTTHMKKNINDAESK